MTVRSPWTKKTNIAGDAPTTGGNAPATCGTPGTRPGQLGSRAQARPSRPENNVIYVQNVPTATDRPELLASSHARRA